MENQENENVRISRNAFKEWLEKLQQESWQLELLISGFALFGIWEARSLVGSIHEYRMINPPSVDYLQSALGFMEFIISMGWRIFFINLLVHVISRGLWIGAIGLRYVSSEINFKVLNYSKKFEDYFQRKVGSFDDYIERLEKFSSVIFAYTFLLFFLFLSFMIFCFWIILLGSLSGSVIVNNPSSLGGVIFFGILILVFVILFFGLVVFIDFITLGSIKRIKEKHISAFYFPIFRFYSIITLSFLYRPLLYNFLDEKYTRRLFLFSIPYVLTIALIPAMHSTSNPLFPIDDSGMVDAEFKEESYLATYYDDERDKVNQPDKNFFNIYQAIEMISLESRELSGKYGKLFLRVYPRDGEWLEEQKGIDPFHRKGILFPFQDAKQKDKLIAKLEKGRDEQLTEIREAKSTLRRQIRKGTLEKQVTGTITEGEELKIDNHFWQMKQDSVTSLYAVKILKEKKTKIVDTKQALLYLNEILIDDVPYSDSLTCNFYVHPNMGERGLLCYFPIGALSEGPHLMHLNKKRYHRNRDSLATILEAHIPFFVLKD